MSPPLLVFEQSLLDPLLQLLRSLSLSLSLSRGHALAAGGRAQQPGLAVQSSSKPKTQTIVRDAALESPHLLHAGEERLQDERLARHNEHVIQREGWGCGHEWLWRRVIHNNVVIVIIIIVLISGQGLRYPTFGTATSHHRRV